MVEALTATITINEGDQSLKKAEIENQKNSDSWCLLYNKAVFCDALYDWICKRC